MNTNQKSTLTSALIATGIGLVFAVIIGYIGGKYKLPIGVTVPIMVGASFVVLQIVRKKRSIK